MSAEDLAGRELVNRIKAQPYNVSPSYLIPVRGEERVRLRAISTSSPAPEDVIRLTDWRNRYVKSFLTEFQATTERTRRWLTGSIANDPSRILFMIEEEGQLPLGYIGLAFIDYESGMGEPDSVVRGEPGRHGIMTLALETLLGWGREHLGITSFGVRVLADNSALNFYQRIGFREMKRVPLERHVELDCVAWKEMNTAQPCSRWLIYMALNRVGETQSSPLGQRSSVAGGGAKS